LVKLYNNSILSEEYEDYSRDFEKIYFHFYLYYNTKIFSVLGRNNEFIRLCFLYLIEMGKVSPRIG
jgi:hypothetical protein